MGCAGGRNDSVAGVSACLLARGRFARVRLSSVSSRRAGRGASRIRPRFRLDDLPRAHSVASSPVALLMPLAACFDGLLRASYLFSISARLVLRLVSHLGWASRCVCLVSDVFFSCSFRLVPRNIVIA